MSHTPHELLEAFPEFSETIHKLKTTDAHFARQYDEYHTINREIHRAETDVEPMSDEHVNTLRKKRMVLRDEIYARLQDNS